MDHIYILNFPTRIIRHQVFFFFNLINNAKNHALYTVSACCKRTFRFRANSCQFKYTNGYRSKAISLEYNDDAQCHENFTFHVE